MRSRLMLPITNRSVTCGKDV